MVGGEFRRCLEGQPVDIDYRIIIPVTTQAARLKRLVSGIADKTKLIIVHNYDHPRTTEVGGELEKEGAEIVPFLGDNRGSCASWNIGLRKMDTTPAEFVIIFSPGTQFPNGADEFVNAVLDAEKNNPKQSYLVTGDGFHTVGITKRLYKLLGLFDENLYPAYRDDADWQRRSFLQYQATSEKKFSQTVFDIEKELTLGTGARNNYIFAHYWSNIDIQVQYYIKKWGGDVGMEKYKLPFGDKPLSYWEPDQTQKVHLSEITKEMADHWAGIRGGEGKEWE